MIWSYVESVKSIEQLQVTMKLLSQVADLSDEYQLEILHKAEERAKTSTMTFQEALDAEIEVLKYEVNERSAEWCGTQFLNV